MEATQRSDFSILMLPWLAHGHVFPFFQLAKNLSKKKFNIYFCSTAINLISVNYYDMKSLSCGFSNIHLVELQLPSFPDLPPRYHTTKNVPLHLFSTLVEAFDMSKSRFLKIINTLNPDLLIHDGTRPWAADIASSVGIPAVVFSIMGATSHSHYFHEKEAFRDGESSGFHDPLKLSHELVLIRSLRGIEAQYIDSLSRFIDKKVVPVGSLVTQGCDDEHSDHIIEWLSKKNKISTVFISFGTQNYLSKYDIEEIAKGLELCDVSFIWVVRFPPGESVHLEEALPDGFLDKVKERGIIIERWAPQAMVLEHPSIGAFVSHCGMGSVLESIYFGVPVVAIPLNYDQPYNAQLLVDAGIAIEIAPDENGRLRSDEIAGVINKIILEKLGEDMRHKAAELSKKLRSEEEQAMNEAAQQLQQLCVEYKQRKQPPT